MDLLDRLAAPFWAPAFTLFGAPTTWGEVAGFVTGALCVWLVARAHVANWPVGLANTAFFGLLFVEAGLFADAGLQVVYAGLGVYGWWAWLRGGPAHDTLPVTRTSPRQWAALAVAGLAGTAALTWLLGTATTSTVPLADAATTTVSLLATWGQTRKKLEQWWLWIAVDVVYVPLYLSKGLTLTALLYLGFIALCVHGLLRWRREVAR